MTPASWSFVRRVNGRSAPWEHEPDILTQVSGVEFEHAWPGRLEVSFFDRVTCPVIGREELLRNKRASARAQDLADVEALEKLGPKAVP